MQSYKFNEIKTNINIKGRTAFIGDVLRLEFTASGFEFCADFKNSPLKMQLNMHGNIANIGVVVDDNSEKKLVIPVSKGLQTITLVDNLNGVHKIRFVKMTEFSNCQIDAVALIFDGDFCERPAEKKLKFEFFGDSLSCGYGNLSPTRNAPAVFGLLEDGYQTWCKLISEKLGAEFNVVASSGQGMLSDCRGNTEGVIDKYWDKALPTLGVKWDFKKYIPDIVFINFGTNDITYTNCNGGPVTNWVDFKEKTRWLLNGIRKNYPDCKIVFPMGRNPEDPNYKAMMQVYIELATEYSEMYVFNDITDNKLGADWHPNVNDHFGIYEQLLKHLTDIFSF